MSCEFKAITVYVHKDFHWGKKVKPGIMFKVYKDKMLLF